MTQRDYSDIEAAIADFEIVSTYIPFDVGTLYVKKIIKAEDLNKLQLRYTVVVSYRGRHVLTTPYSMGIGHIPEGSGPKGQRGWTNDKLAWITEVMKTGKAGRWSGSFGQVNTQPILPEKRDVIWSLIMDGDAIDHAGFESWASDYGYDTDSRKAEETYRACVEIGLKMRATLGDEKLKALRDVYQDY